MPLTKVSTNIHTLSKTKTLYKQIQDSPVFSLCETSDSLRESNWTLVDSFVGVFARVDSRTRAEILTLNLHMIFKGGLHLLPKISMFCALSENNKQLFKKNELYIL